MNYVLWLLLIGLDGVPEFTPVGMGPLTRGECLAVARYERMRRASNPWHGKTFVWCDPERGWPVRNMGRSDSLSYFPPLTVAAGTGLNRHIPMNADSTR